MITRERIIQSLFGIAAALLVINIFVENKEPEIIRNLPSKISLLQLDSIFTVELHDFGIGDDWYKRISVSNPNYDSLKYVYHITVPADLPRISLLRDIQKKFSAYDVQLKISERKQNTESDIKFYRNGYLVSQAIFKRSFDRFRRAGELKIILLNDWDGIPNTGYLKLPFNLDIALRPSTENIAVADSIISSGKGFVLLIDDLISDNDYLLEESLGKRKLKSSVNRICSDFKNARLFVIDVRSDVFNSISYNLIRDQFRANAFSLVSLQRLQIFNSGAPAELKSRFRFLIDNIKPDEQRTIVVHSEIFDHIRGEIDRAVQLGVRLIK